MITEARAREIERASQLLIGILVDEFPCPCCDGTGSDAANDVPYPEQCHNCCGAGYEIPDEFDVEDCEEVNDADVPS